MKINYLNGPKVGPTGSGLELKGKRISGILLDRGRCKMRGVGGPLLCVDDLLHDLSQDAGGSAGAVSPPASCDDASPLPPSRLIGLFEETYDRLNESLAGTDHSWTQLTLKLCYAVEAADKLISLAQSNSKVLLEKVDNLENTVKRCHSVLEAARALIGDKSEEEIAVDDQEG